MTPVDATETFRQEAQELLEQLEHTLLEIGHRPGDADLIDTAFRALHTIKGSGAMFGFDRVAAFTHHVETTFDLVRKGKIAATAELIALTLAAKDQMRQLIEAPDAASDADGQAILARLQAAVDGASGAAAPAESGPTTWRVNFRLPSGAMATGSNPLLLIEELRGLGDATVTAQTAMVPALEDLDPTECHVAWSSRVAEGHWLARHARSRQAGAMRTLHRVCSRRVTRSQHIRPPVCLAGKEAALSFRAKGRPS
jgi:two-component system chemotaxis sensor kinase CheA